MHPRLKTVLAASLFAIAASTAASAGSLPKEYHGTWCLTNLESAETTSYATYERGNCSRENRIMIRANRFDSIDAACRTVKTEGPFKKYSNYRMTYRCAGEGEEAVNGIIKLTMWLFDGSLHTEEELR